MAEWKRIDRYYQERGDHRVSAARVRNRWRYSAWRRSGEKWEWLGTFDDVVEAQKVCDESA